MSSREEGRIRAQDGVELAYRLVDDGPGRPLVLLHGGGANLEAMDQFRERLGRGRRTVAFDARCCGQSGDPTTFSWQDAARDVDTVVTALGLGAVDVIGHSMGGFVGGFYATDHPGARLVSIDGFGPGMPTVGTASDQAAFLEFQSAMRSAFWAMTEAPDEGDRTWRDAQVADLVRRYPGMGYTAPNGPAVAARNLVDLGHGRYRRHPSRLLFEGGFADGGDVDVLRMYRGLSCPALLLRCSESGAPPVLDLELRGLAAANPRVEVVWLPTSHLGPAWDALDAVVAVIEPFLALRSTSP